MGRAAAAEAGGCGAGGGGCAGQRGKLDNATGQRSDNAAALGPYGSGGVASRWGSGVTAEPEQIARGLSLAELAEATNMWWVTYAKDIENTQIDTLVRAKSASKAEVEAAAGCWV